MSLLPPEVELNGAESELVEPRPDGKRQELGLPLATEVEKGRDGARWFIHGKRSNHE